MGITGIICEFNPLHNGHQLLIQRAKLLCPDNDIALVMSGNVVQRGELASFDKATRANWAIKAGADIVFELPVVFSNSYAMQFARGGVSLLSKIDDVTDLVFGSECGDIASFKNFSETYGKGDSKFKSTLFEFLDRGLSYPRAFSCAVEKLETETTSDGGFVTFLSPNNILGIEYINAIEFFKSKITPHTITREKNTQTLMSASQLRELILNLGKQNLDAFEPFIQLKPFLPDFVYADLMNQLPQDDVNDNLFTLLQNKILTSQTSLSTISEVTEGIENRFIKGIELANCFEEYIRNIKTKRYTLAKIKRILISILLDKTTVQDGLAFENIDYIKVLAVKSSKKSMLGLDSRLKFITKTSDFSNLSESSAEFLRMDKMADDLFKICNQQKVTKIYTHKMLIVD